MNARTSKLTRDEIRDVIYSEYLTKYGFPKQQWENHCAAKGANMEVRKEFKYAAYNSITGTPFFQANGIVLENGYDLDAAGWQKLFESLDHNDIFVSSSSRAPMQM